MARPTASQNRRRNGLKTPGREPETEVIAAAPVLTGDNARARGFIAALGGAGNLVSVDACTTRLRLVVADQEKVDGAALKALAFTRLRLLTYA